MEIALKVLQEFKDRMRITHSSEDDNLKTLLSFSVADITEKCGAFDIEKNIRAKELVFERTRYAYNDALEYFDNNFLSQINSLGLSIALAEEGESDAAV
ncbi:phage gp6-like head-tail connector protein [Niallia sp. NCCP-28]|uniref:phage gp6-like head-tail connector protein n=1 Tax=Niallia sp. NCCP-28 TaxID=2934712 RepID=UPI00208B7548|nr:phage gp6-like head-tail connector protein [Niallia sp. NCCP-28]GKU81205.1 hypothetical protein NCCP28_06010 [Niallia sp. NCCP-28]